LTAPRHGPLCPAKRLLEEATVPSRSSRLTRVVAGAVVAGALVTPAAQAAPAPAPGGNRSVSSTELRATGSPVIERSIHDGFVWGDAAVGAGAATAVLLLGAAGMSAASRRHGRLTTAR
jgi:hypothetical protein